MGLKQSPYGRTLTLTLPSGIKVKARRPSVLSLIAAGGFPSELTVDVWKLVKKEKLDPDKIVEDPEGIVAWAKLIDAYVPHVLVDPRICTAPGELTELHEVDGGDGLVTGQLNIRDVIDMDKQVVFLFGNDAAAADEELTDGVGGRVSELADALRRFRVGPARGEAGRGGEEVRQEAVGVAEPGPAEPAVA